jgi:hypothetical protein
MIVCDGDGWVDHRGERKKKQKMEGKNGGKKWREKMEGKMKKQRRKKRAVGAWQRRNMRDSRD